MAFIIVPPVFGKKAELCSLNNMSRWYRFQKTKIKQEFKEYLEAWFLPLWDDCVFTKAEISYTVLRKDAKKLDADNLTIIYKWFQDLLVENSYLSDDDKVKVILNPTILNAEDSEFETSVLISVKLTEKYTMTIEELKAKAEALNIALSKVGDEHHVKSASGRARKILGEIKNATPELRRQLVALDKNKK